MANVARFEPDKWGKLSGSAYIVARPVGGGREFRLRIYDRQSSYDLNFDDGPCVLLTDERALETWQWDYDLYFDRTGGGRRLLAKYGDEVDKFKNPRHSAHRYAAEDGSKQDSKS